jgi:flagellar protein FlgJ
LLDQQMAQTMATSGKGVGFAKLIEQQLGRSFAAATDSPSTAGVANAAADPLAAGRA